MEVCSTNTHLYARREASWTLKDYKNDRTVKQLTRPLLHSQLTVKLTKSDTTKKKIIAHTLLTK